MIYDEVLDAFKILKDTGDVAHTAFVSHLVNLNPIFKTNLDSALLSGSKQDLDQFFTDLEKLIEESKTTAPDAFEKIKGENPTKYDTLQKLKNLEPDHLKALTNNSVKEALEVVRAAKGFNNDIDHVIFSGADVDIPALLERNGVKPLTGPLADGKVGVLTNPDGSPQYSKDINLLIARLESAQNSRATAVDYIETVIFDKKILVENKTIDNPFFADGLKEEIAKIDDADEKIEAIRLAAEAKWLEVYDGSTAQSMLNRDVIMGRKTRAEADAEIAKIAEKEAAEKAAEEAKNGKPTNAVENATDERTHRQKIGDGVANLAVGAKNKTLGWMNENRWWTATGVVLTPVVGFATIAGLSDDTFSPRSEDGFQSSMTFTVLDDIDDIDEAKEESEEIKEMADKLKEKSDAALAEIDNKLIRITNLIDEKQKAGETKAAEALTKVYEQVETIKKAYVANDVDLFTYKQAMETGFKEIDIRHDAIMKSGNTPTELAEAKRLLAQQQFILALGGTIGDKKVDGLEINKAGLDQTLLEIEKAIGQATLSNPSPNLGAGEKSALDARQKAIDAENEKKKKEAEAAKAKADEEARKAAAVATAKAQAAVQNAGTPAAGLADAKTKAKNNGDIGQTILDDIDRLVAKGKDDQNKASLYATIQAGLDYATNKQDQAGIDRFTALKVELDALNEKADKTATDSRAVLADIRNHTANVDAIQSDALINQANAEIAEQGQKLKDLAKSRDELKNEYGLIGDAIKANKTVAELKASGVTQSTATQPQQSAPSGGGSSGGSSSGSAAKKSNLPPEIDAAKADIHVMANHKGGFKKPGTLSDGTTKVEYGIGSLLDQIDADILKTEMQIIRIEKASAELKAEGKVAEGVAHDNGILRDMRSSLQSMYTNKNAASQLGLNAQQIMKDVDGYTTGADIQKAQIARDNFKVLYAQVLDHSRSVQDIKKNNDAKLEGNETTRKILSDDISVFKKKPSELLEIMSDGKEGLLPQVFGSKNGAPSVAGSYLSLAAQKIGDLHTGWQEYGQSLDSQGARNWWMVADIGGKVVLGSMAINLFNNTLGSMAGFKVDGWKSIAILGIIAAVGIHGTGETGRAMEEANTVRDYRHSNNPLAQGGGIDIGRKTASTGGANIPNSGSVAVLDQKTGKETHIATFEKKGDEITLQGPNGQIEKVAVAEVNEIAKNIVEGSGKHVPASFDQSTLNVPHSETVADARMMPPPSGKQLTATQQLGG